MSVTNEELIRLRNAGKITFDKQVYLIVDELLEFRASWHSDPFVVMFLGYLTAKLPELHQTNPPQLLEAWDEFKIEMGKRGER
jgi:hypothetical protein